MKNTIISLFFDSKKKKVKLDQRVLIFFFCLVLSTFFWLLAALSKNYSTILKVHLSYSDLPEEYIFTQNPSTTFEIQASGNGFNLLGEQYKLNRNPISVSLFDFLNEDKSRHAVSTENLAENIKQELHSGLQLDKIYLDSIRFKTNLQETREIVVEPLIDLSFESGYKQFGEIQVEPKTVKVIGPKDLIMQLESITTEIIQLKGIKKSINGVYQLDLKSMNELLVVKPSKVEITIPVEKFTEKVIELPIKINSKKNKREIKTFPESVKVIFNVPISRFEELNKDKLQAFVDLDAHDHSKSKLLVELTGVPANFELVRIEPDKVEYIILN